MQVLAVVIVLLVFVVRPGRLVAPSPPPPPPAPPTLPPRSSDLALVTGVKRRNNATPEAEENAQRIKARRAEEAARKHREYEEQHREEFEKLKAARAANKKQTARAWATLRRQAHTEDLAVERNEAIRRGSSSNVLTMQHMRALELRRPREQTQRQQQTQQQRAARAERMRVYYLSRNYALWNDVAVPPVVEFTADTDPVIRAASELFLRRIWAPWWVCCCCSYIGPDRNRFERSAVAISAHFTGREQEKLKLVRHTSQKEGAITNISCRMAAYQR